MHRQERDITQQCSSSQVNTAKDSHKCVKCVQVHLYLGEESHTAIMIDIQLKKSVLIKPNKINQTNMLKNVNILVVSPEQNRMEIFPLIKYIFDI